MKTKLHNKAKFYILKFISGFYFIYAIQTLYLLSKGITVTELALFASIVAISSTLLEIPTGYIADKFSRKISISLGFLSQAIAYSALIFASNITALIPIAILLGLGSSLMSGSIESLVYDMLGDKNKDDEFLKTNSRGSTIGTISGAFATFVGPIIFVANHELPFILTGVVLLILAFYVLTIDEKSQSLEVKRNISIFDGIKNIIKSKQVLIITLVDLVLLLLVNMFYQVSYFPKLSSLGLGTEYMGILDVVNLALMAAVLIILPRLVFKSEKKSLFMYSVGVILVFLLFSATSNLVLALVFGVSFDLIWSARKHIVPAITNKYFTTANRATSISSMSFVSNLGAALLLPLFVSVVTTSYLYLLIPLVLTFGLLLFYSDKNSKETLPVRGN